MMIRVSILLTLAVLTMPCRAETVTCDDTGLRFDLSKQGFEHVQMNALGDGSTILSLLKKRWVTVLVQTTPLTEAGRKTVRKRLSIHNTSDWSPAPKDTGSEVYHLRIKAPYGTLKKIKPTKNKHFQTHPLHGVYSFIWTEYTVGK
jgi:hypothetical protein